MSSKYTRMKELIPFLNISFISRYKVPGALQSPNGITRYSHWARFVQKAVFSTESSAIAIWWYPYVVCVQRW